MDSKYASVDNSNLKRKFEIKKIENASLQTIKKAKVDKTILFKKPKNKVNKNTNNFNNNKDSNATILEHRKSLPVYGVRGRLLEEIRKHDTVIIIGETGSGKTTQIPQLIHESRLEGAGMVGITQPRRVAAITVAMRVAQEMNTPIGGFVGYTVRFEDTTSHKTKVKYMTDGMLLREAMLDPLLTAYSFLILDEAHERTVSTDIIFGIIKLAQKDRKEKNVNPLKIIVMSATMDVDVFSTYLNNCPVIYLEGRTFPVTIYHTKTQPSDYQQAALCTVFQLHKDSPINEDILVFLTGQEEIETLAYNIRQIAKEIGGGLIRVCPLFASLPQGQQLEVWRPLPPTIRKVVLATNIAETSITIPNIKYVIDTGVVKTRWCCGCASALRVEKCSQAACWQRAGRAGRMAPGHCYRLYSAASLRERAPHATPPILRSPLAPTVLHLLTLGVHPLTFDLIDKPPEDAVKEALQLLKQLGAISKIENPSLLPTGKKMAAFPIDPMLSKVILCANDFGCLEEILTIVALLSTDGVFYSSVSKREEALKVKAKFVSKHGDHLTLLNVYKEFIIAQSKKKWCREHFLKMHNLEYAKNVRQQLLELCQKYNMQVQSCGQAVEKVLKCLISGLFMNSAWVRGGPAGGRYTTAAGPTAALHPSSVLHGRTPPPSCLLYSELISTQRTYISILSVIQADWLHEIVPDFARKCRITH